MASFDCANLTTGHREAAREKDLQDQAPWHRQLWVLMNATYKNAGRGRSQGRQGGRFWSVLQKYLKSWRSCSTFLYPGSNGGTWWRTGRLLQHLWPIAHEFKNKTSETNSERAIKIWKDLKHWCVLEKAQFYRVIFLLCLPNIIRLLKTSPLKFASTGCHSEAPVIRIQIVRVNSSLSE